ncbi:hypothetical protein WN55_01850 [Dufourea novaeangliae]|uniref:Uncharacterized protein n=1 Tax=Dufourea novaeangliae TaxID=178035 RepID=A0A154PF03_DUFNO|nr:hypothetical protein WN55_01850 [Dufourea novaeangliae]
MCIRWNKFQFDPQEGQKTCLDTGFDTYSDCVDRFARIRFRVAGGLITPIIGASEKTSRRYLNV